jgi:hypothetical protein
VNYDLVFLKYSYYFNVPFPFIESPYIYIYTQADLFISEKDNLLFLNEGYIL